MAAGKACALVIAIFFVAKYMISAYQEGQVVSERDSVGVDASTTGSVMWSAYKSCSLVGVKDLVLCENQPQQLIDDTVAATLAKTANSMHRAYEAKCEKHYSKQYCYDLLNRAFHIAQRRPVEQ